MKSKTMLYHRKSKEILSHVKCFLLEINHKEDKRCRVGDAEIILTAIIASTCF